MIMFLKVMVMWFIISIVGTLGPLGISFLIKNNDYKPDFIIRWLSGVMVILTGATAIGLLYVLYDLSVIFIGSFGL